MAEFLELLSAYESWIEEKAAKYGLSVEVAKEMVEAESKDGVCEGCLDYDGCPARLYLVEKNKPDPREASHA